MFVKASKTQLKLRLALYGGSGSGKTFSSLAIASHLMPDPKIAVIDTEHGSASRYAGAFEFDTCSLQDHHPGKYIEAIQAAQEMGYDVVIVDSLTHAWYSELGLVGGNFNNWNKVRPIERQLISTLLSARCHLIVTMRAKTRYSVEKIKTSRGESSAPKIIGTVPVQSPGVEYEFDIVGELSQDHILTIEKSRCSDLADRQFLNPGRGFAMEVSQWLTESEQPWVEPDHSKAARVKFARECEGVPQSVVVDLLQKAFKVSNPKDLTSEQVDSLVGMIRNNPSSSPSNK